MKVYFSGRKLLNNYAFTELEPHSFKKKSKRQIRSSVVYFIKIKEKQSQDKEKNLWAVYAAVAAMMMSISIIANVALEPFLGLLLEVQPNNNHNNLNSECKGLTNAESAAAPLILRSLTATKKVVELRHENE